MRYNLRWLACLYTIIGDKKRLARSRYDPEAERSCIDMQGILAGSDLKDRITGIRSCMLYGLQCFGDTILFLYIMPYIVGEHMNSHSYEQLFIC